MKRFYVFLPAVFFVLAGPSLAQKPYFQQFVHYTIRVRLDTEQHKLTGSETILYKNNSPDTLTEFYLHLYPNAFKNKKTAYMRDFRRAFNYTLFDVPKKYRSYLDIFDVTVDGQSVTPEIDDTIARMALPAPLPPGDSMTVSLNFEEKIRRHLGRAGYRGKHYDLAQWYPKVVVYDENGFHPDKFRTGEFYGEFGTFDVYIEVPEHYVVAATGVVRDGDPGWTLNPPAGKKSDRPKTSGSVAYKTIHFHAEDVHDFAWSADPDFVVQDTTLSGVDIMSFYRKQHKDWKDTTLVHGVRAMEWLTAKVGPYPYPQVSIVDALLSGGMEYPMLVMDGRVSEGLVLHEIGHIYFFGIFGNDERVEAWLDEGFTTFQTSWYMQHRYGPYGLTHKWNWYERLTPQFTEMQRLRNRVFPMLRLGYGERVATRAEEFKHGYYPMVYQKAALMYFALRYVVGAETFDRILEEYYARWHLKHVNEASFRQVCEEVSGMDLGWFFDQWLHTRKICDYRLSEIKTHRNDEGEGVLTKVKIERRGEITMPVTVVFTFDDGSKESSRLDGRLRTIEKVFNLEKKPSKVALNPENEIADINLSDNFIPRRRSLQIDWPNNDYFPDDAYQIRYRPEVWYNDIDGAKIGLHLRGSYANFHRRRSLGIYYGAESERVDFTASWKRPMRLFSNNAAMSLSGYKMEGRVDGTFSLLYRIRKELLRPPTHDFKFGFNYHELRNARFIENPETYQEEPDFGWFVGYDVHPQLDVASTRLWLNLRTGREWFGGEYKYTRLETEATLKTRAEFVPVDARLRFFLGLVGGTMPLQQKFSIADGGPLARERRFWLRSPGAVWDELDYHEPGHGNLRGYLEGTFGVNKLAAFNFELGRPVPFLSKAPGRFLGEIKVMGFVDVGWIFDGENPIIKSPRVTSLVNQGILDETLVDAGVGFRLNRNFPFYDMHLRLDFPFFANHPEINGETDEVTDRYVFSLTTSF